MRIIEAMDFESDTSNWRYPFEKMCKQYGKEFIDMLRAMWQANGGGQTEDEFIKMNGIPMQFFIKNVRSWV